MNDLTRSRNRNGKNKEVDNNPNTTSTMKKYGEFLRINKQTLPLKVTLFLYYGAMAAILPYLTIHMQDIGISIQETAVIYAVLPFASFVGPPIMGFLADKLGQYKTVLIIITLGNGIFHTLLLFVPIYKEVHLEAATSFTWNPLKGQAELFPQESRHCSAFLNHFIQYLNDHDDEIEFDCHNASIQNQQNSDLLQSVKLHLDKSEMSVNNCSVTLMNPQGGIYSLRRSNDTRSCHTDWKFDTGEMEIMGNNSITFWLYFLLRVVANIFMTSCFSLLDATTLALVAKCGGTDYGKERIWSIIALATVSPIAGLLNDVVSKQKGHADYSSAFYVSDALLILNVVAYFFMKLDIEKPEEGFLKNGGKLLKYPEVVVFLIMIFILGNMWGFVESYLFIFLKELKAPQYLLGLTLTVGSLTGLPFLWGAEKIVAKIGRVNVIVLSFLTYFVRFFGYSFINDPFWCFPFEAMEAITYHLMWVAAATYCGVLAPKGLLATLTGIMGSLHYSLGKGNGGFIGGYLLGVIGTRLAFRYFGIASAVFGVIYFLVNQIVLKGVIKRRRIEEPNGDENENADKNDPDIINSCPGNGETLDTFQTNTNDDEEEETVDDDASKSMLESPTKVLNGGRDLPKIPNGSVPEHSVV